MARKIIDLYLDGNMWCAIYPMGADLMNCEAVEFMPIRKELRCSGFGERIRDMGRFDALQELKDKHSIPTESFHCEYWD